MKLDGRVVLVTGGSAGIGLAIAKAFVEKQSTVIVCGRDPARLERAKRELPALETVACDVGSAEGRAQLVSFCSERFPALDVLVNNAGIMQTLDFTAPGSVTAAAVEREIQINLSAPILLTLALLPQLSRQSAAAVVNVSSALGYVPLARTPVYCATKSAVHSFTQSLRWQLAATPVQVFELVPSAADTEAAHDFEGAKLTPAEVATALLKGLARDTPEIRVGQAGQLHRMSRIAPGFIHKMINKAK